MNAYSLAAISIVRASGYHSVGTVEFLVDDLRAQLGALPLEVRLDGAFCQPQILRFLADSGVEWAMRIPLWEWLPIRGEIAKRKRWKRVAPGIDGFFLSFPIEKWGVRLRAAIYRKRVSHETQKNFQLNLFTPDDGHWEYSAIGTNKRVTLKTLWAFLAGRGGHEKTLCELKPSGEDEGSRRRQENGSGPVRSASTKITRRLAAHSAASSTCSW